MPCHSMAMCATLTLPESTSTLVRTKSRLKPSLSMSARVSSALPARCRRWMNSFSVMCYDDKAERAGSPASLRPARLSCTWSLHARRIAEVGTGHVDVELRGGLVDVDRVARDRELADRGVDDRHRTARDHVGQRIGDGAGMRAVAFVEVRRLDRAFRFAREADGDLGLFTHRHQRHGALLGPAADRVEFEHELPLGGRHHIAALDRRWVG